MKTLQFVAMVLNALALVPGGAHLFALPNKIHLSETDYFITQSVYSGWALFGIVLIGAILASLALAVRIRDQRAPFIFTVINLFCLLATLAIFFVFTYPANQATNNWIAISDNWQQLRWQWEVSHAVNAVITFIGFCSLTISVLLAKEQTAAKDV